MRSALPAFIISVVLVGCATAPKESAAPKLRPAPTQVATTTPVKPLPPADWQPESFWPLKTGNSWKYEIQNEGAQASLTEIIVQATGYDNDRIMVPGTVHATTQLGKGSEVLERDAFLVGKEGIWQSASFQLVPSTPPRQLIKFPFVPGDQIHQTVSSCVSGSENAIAQDVTTTMKGTVTVDTGVGRMEAYEVDSTSVYTLGSNKITEQTTSFWVPRIGLVRYNLQVSDPNGVKQKQTWRLTSHNITNP